MLRAPGCEFAVLPDLRFQYAVDTSLNRGNGLGTEFSLD